MADSTTTPVLSVHTTYNSKLSDFAIKDGQLIFIQDKQTIALDFGSKRKLYNQIEELATEETRKSLLAPVTGRYYYVMNPPVLWRYQADGWVQITTPPEEINAHLTDTNNPHGVTASQIGAAEESHTHPEQVSFHGVTTSGDGSTYIASVDGIDSLVAGVSFIMIPHVTSTVIMPKINVNGLGDKIIRRRLSTNTASTVAGSSVNWLGANKPIRITYDGTYWIVDTARPSATDIYGIIPITSGGTGASNADSARANLGAMADVPVTVNDAGKFLRVSSEGVWVAETIPDAESSRF